MTDDVTRRTWLAAERTFLAWSRSGLAAFAVAIAMGRVVPALTHQGTPWPDLVAGLGYGLLGTGFLGYGLYRHRSMNAVLSEGGFQRLPDWVAVVIAVYGIALGLFTTGVVVANA
jgi:uncharacterized membrane protein YidH (DUF202 family)